MLVHHFFTSLQPEMLTDGVRTSQCDCPSWVEPFASLVEIGDYFFKWKAMYMTLIKPLSPLRTNLNTRTNGGNKRHRCGLKSLMFVGLENIVFELSRLMTAPPPDFSKLISNSYTHLSICHPSLSR